MSAFNLFKKSETKPKARKKAEKPVAPETEAPLATTPSAPVISLNSALLHAYVSEKATRLESFNKYMFKVARTANKPEIKKAIEARFGVSVIAVHMVNMPSKTRTVGRHVGSKSGFRKAIVTLKKGDSINSAKA